MNTTQFDRQTIRCSLQVRFNVLINKVSSNQKWEMEKIEELAGQVKKLMWDCKVYGLEDKEIAAAYTSLDDIWNYLRNKYSLR